MYDLLPWNFISRYTLQTYIGKNGFAERSKFWLDTDQKNNFVELSK